MKLYKIPHKVHWTKWGSDQLEEKNGTMFFFLFFCFRLDGFLCFLTSFLCLDFPTLLD